jgi:DpnII restriction endonuclease
LSPHRSTSSSSSVARGRDAAVPWGKDLRPVTVCRRRGWLRRNEPGQASASVSSYICRRFPRYVRQLAERHAGRPALVIDDEYDVQDHLHALLRLHFDDVREEEWAPSYGGSRTRMDFLLKRERMVVETKMTRDRLDQAKVVDELVIDKAHYRQHPDCKTLVCFVYDPDHRLANPDALESDVSGDENGLTTRVIVAPQPSS